MIIMNPFKTECNTDWIRFNLCGTSAIPFLVIQTALIYNKNLEFKEEFI